METAAKGGLHMASLRDTVKQYQEELRDGIAWIAFWREGRSWNGEDFYLDTGDSLTAEQKSRLEEIRQKDPAAVILNSYYCGYLAGDMTVDELTAGVRRHYENGYNDVVDFIAAHDDTLSPEVLEKARALAHAAGLPFYEKPYNGEEIDPYIYDGYMSIEDYELMHQKIEQERSEHLAEQFSILIDSRSRFETGQPGGVWLSMPTTIEQFHKAMNRIDITAENSQDFFINGFANTEQQPFDVPLSVIQSAGIDELNYFGKLLEMQGDADKGKFTAAVTLGEYAGSVKGLINLAQNLDCYWIYPSIQDEEAYGHYLIDELDELELPETAKNYFMYVLCLKAQAASCISIDRRIRTAVHLKCQAALAVCCLHCLSKVLQAEQLLRRVNLSFREYIFKSVNDHLLRILCGHLHIGQRCNGNDSGNGDDRSQYLDKLLIWLGLFRHSHCCRSRFLCFYILCFGRRFLCFYCLRFGRRFLCFYCLCAGCRFFRLYCLRAGRRFRVCRLRAVVFRCLILMFHRSPALGTEFHICFLLCSTLGTFHISLSSLVKGSFRCLKCCCGCPFVMNLSKLSNQLFF